MARTTIFRYARDGSPLGAIDFLSATHVEELDGTDELVVRTHVALSKGDRLVWKDGAGTWHEHIVDSYERKRDGGVVTEATCINSFAEMYGSLASGTKVSGSVSTILISLLSGTRWVCGTCDVEGTFTVESWHKSVHDAVSDLVNECGGEFETVIMVGDGGVTGRVARIRGRRGSSIVTRQFAYGKNVAGASKSVGGDDPITAVKAYGAKTNTESTEEYAARLTVEAKNDALVPKYGTPQEDGTLGHTWAVYTDDACDDATFLLQQAQRTLRNLSKPDLEYEYELTDIEGSRLEIGDAVSVVDSSLDSPFEDRLTRIERDLSGKTGGIVRIGKRRNALVEQFEAADRTSQQTTGNTSQVASTTPGYTGGNYGGSGGSDFANHYLNDEPMAPGTRILFYTPHN